MQITSFQLSNYKSFNEAVKVEFAQGMNVITGQNNAGKTALLEALSFQFSTIPHRSLKTVPTAMAKYNDSTRIEVSFQVSKQELQELLLEIRGASIFLPQPRFDTEFARSAQIHQHNAPNKNAENLLNWLLSQETLTFRLAAEQQLGTTMRWSPSGLPSFGRYDVARSGSQQTFEFNHVTIQTTHALKFTFQPNNTNGPDQNEIGALLGPLLIRRVYVFRAERLNIGACAFGATAFLAPDARNLAEVLNILQQNQARFDRFNGHVHDILPQVRRVAVRPSTAQSGSVEIVIWPHDPASERADLAVPLANCGTGIGQVLAILYVVLNSDLPQAIVIDEPQSFLHPGASRKLVEILRQHPEHQYIISTHSPTVITAADPQQVLMIRLQDGESSVEAMNAKAAATQRACLLEIGATLADVFGADNILWVEGATEEACFPLILEKLAKKSLGGTVIKGVVATGDFEGRGRHRRRAELVFDIYDRLSNSGSLIPPAVGFIFDTDGRSHQEQVDLNKRAKGRLYFTAKRMYENYLLNPAAIAAVINAQLASEAPTGAEIVQGKLTGLMADAKYYESAPPVLSERQISVDGAGVLAALFSLLSDGKLEYRKTTHSILLTEWLIQHAPDELADIKKLLLLALTPAP